MTEGGSTEGVKNKVSSRLDMLRLNLRHLDSGRFFVRSRAIRYARFGDRDRAAGADV